MTDPLEDHLRLHLADRAGRVTVDPDPTAVVERSAGRRRIGAPLVATVVAVAALLAGGGFTTGMAVAGPSRASNAPLAASAPEGGSLSTTTIGRGAMPSTAAVVALTPLFVRSTDSGATIRAYTSSIGPITGCPPGALCVSPGGVPPIAPCPPGAKCAQPVTTPAGVPDPTIPVTGSGGSPGPGSSPGSPGSAGGGVSGSPEPGPMTTTTTPAVAGCRQLTLELSTAQAVWSTSLPTPATDGIGPKSVQLVGTGTFGEAEGAPTAVAVVAVSPDVTVVRLVSSSGAVLDAMAPTAGIAVMATTGANGLAGTTVVGLDAGGATVATVPSDQGTSNAAGGCGVLPPQPTPVTTVPGGPVPTTTGPVTSTVVPPSPPAPVIPATRPGPSA